VTFVLDASAVLAAILVEDGADVVIANMANGHLSAVNLSETITKLIEYGVSPQEAMRQIGRLELEINAFDSEQAEATACLRKPTKQFGLSLGDRACLALGKRLGMPILTSDERMWASKENVGLDIRMIR
jgi:ribonuclease VapC